jgi:hypothetical protein
MKAHPIGYVITIWILASSHYLCYWDGNPTLIVGQFEITRRPLMVDNLVLSFEEVVASPHVNA